MTMTAVRGAVIVDENNASKIEKAAFEWKYYPAVGITKAGIPKYPRRV
jgi:hypothetical protein